MIFIIKKNTFFLGGFFGENDCVTLILPKCVPNTLS